MAVEQDIRELWDRVIALEARVAELEDEGEVLGTVVLGPDCESECDTGGVGSDLSEE